VHEKEGDLSLLIHPERPVWMVVNDMGLEMVRLGEKELSLSEISTIISNRYGVKRQKVDQDVIKFFQDMNHAGLLETPGALSYKPSLQNLFFHLNNRCNLACKHCYVSAYSKNGELDTDTVFSLIDQLVSMGGKSITLSGGEPLLRSDIKGILSYASKRVKVRLLTNGILIDKTLAQFMVSLGMNVQISLDGSNALIHDSIRGKGTFSQVLETIHLLQENGIGDRLDLCTTIMKQNIRDISKIIVLADELSIRRVRFLPLRKVGRARQLWGEINADVGREDYETLYEYIFYQAMREHPSVEISSGLSGFILSAPKDEPSGIWCPIGRNLVITAEGDCYPCVLLMTEEYLLGNVKEKALGQIWESTVLKELTVALEERRSQIMKCKGCAWKNFCQGGCVGLSKEHTGTIWDSDDFCSFRKKLYRKTIFELVSKKSSIISKSEDCF
jgi:radical SAM protein with 4Fe4S-binding SPASM domain